MFSDCKDKTAKVFLKYILEVAKSKYKEQRTRKYELKEYLVSYYESSEDGYKLTKRQIY